MKDAQPKTIYLKDYRSPDFLIDKTDLSFELGEQSTRVFSTLSMRRNPSAKKDSGPLVLQGEGIELVSIAINGKTLAVDQYQLTPESLTIHSVPDQFTLACDGLIKPQENTSLEGLYKSRAMYCTQCEAEGFRKITYYLDRPDVMSEFCVVIEADKSRYPVLLSNGNPVEKGERDNGRHWVKWHDPFKKPAYLFALVAGALEHIDSHYTTGSGRDILLRIFVEAKDVDKCDHAMQSLKQAMKWDEEVYGREYDLDIFMIVAVDDFNMGAMENKGLNIFNTSCVLAKPETTTDVAFQRVQGVVAHEYFHNWSGNRVTCRDWFQLSLKEGFTVFRDQEFSADMGSRTVKRVEDVSFLRTAQFAEDEGPMAHPVQPSSYMEISNFYTLTIYEKGAEIVRMIHNLLGADNFRKGTDLYFARHDGQAVTIDDFVKTMEEASARNLTQFKRWYRQAGTPRLEVSDQYDRQSQQYRLTIKQLCPVTNSAAHEEVSPYHIPVAMGIIGGAGALPLKPSAQSTGNISISVDNTQCVLELAQAEQTFVFEQVSEKPVPSLLRGFSAPVKLHYRYSRDDLMLLMQQDSDGFCRWDASQRLGVAVIGDVMEASSGNKTPTVDTRLIEAYRSILNDPNLDKAMVALMLSLPSEAYLSEIAEQIDVEAIHRAREYVRKSVAQSLQADFLQVYQQCQDDQTYRPDAEGIARRSLKNKALSYLMLNVDEKMLGLCQQQIDAGSNMTDVLSALGVMVNSDSEWVKSAKIAALANFYQHWQHEPLVVNQWLAVQAGCILPGTLDRVKTLLTHAAFDIKNPNKVRSLTGVFCKQNAINFHHQSGEGYSFLADQVIKLNTLNPQIAARLLAPLTKWKKYNSNSQVLMKSALEHIADQPKLSKDVFEVVSKSLKC